jgi:hypothetical protein
MSENNAKDNDGTANTTSSDDEIEVVPSPSKLQPYRCFALKVFDMVNEESRNHPATLSWTPDGGAFSLSEGCNQLPMILEKHFHGKCCS